MKIPEWLKLPALIVGAIGAIVVTAQVITRYSDVPGALSSHMAESNKVHAAIDEREDELHGHAERMEKLQQQMWQERATEQCMENPYKMLAMQKLLTACDSLGIDRRPGDIPPAELP